MNYIVLRVTFGYDVMKLCLFNKKCWKNLGLRIFYRKLAEGFLLGYKYDVFLSKINIIL